METRLFEITLKDGRFFRVFCANKHQINRFFRTIEPTMETWTMANGIHTVKQWEEIIKSEVKD